ncbi:MULTISPECIES: tyrosine-type recombinase/integrase [Janthinobacterium]|uniref:tyrosine-type recombinase/integrase n=1 Tax=Janthinobacterium TaxID=29580 RepID=UPI001C5AF61E|nr:MULTISPECIES: tyrosine-type recombinase/integrase [Janthinobacterium]MBW3511211.1 site-specific integrase [Janthinobacterium sp. NKUCC06_STL]MCA1863219.1 site-specific integrase [Janthinobacterium lividum]
MAQAKTLTEKELKRILAFIATKRHTARNRAMLLMTHLTGMRAGEVAALLVKDVLSEKGRIRPEIRLLPDRTKGACAACS